MEGGADSLVNVEYSVGILANSQLAPFLVVSSIRAVASPIRDMLSGEHRLILQTSHSTSIEHNVAVDQAPH